MKKYLLVLFLFSIGFNQTAKSMNFNNYSESWSNSLSHSIDTRDVITIISGMIASYLYVNAATNCAMNHYQAFLEKSKKLKPFPKKALIKQLKQQNSTPFNSRKKGFYKFGKR